MSTAQLIPNVAPTWVNSNGVPLAGGSIYSYAAGTTTPQATYTDETAGTPNANPVVLNSAGQAQIWLRTDLAYKIIVNDSSGNQISSTDQINIVNPGSIDKTKIAANIAGVALLQNGGTSAIDVQVDGVTIGVNGSNQLYIPTGGVTASIFSASSRLEVLTKWVRDLSSPGLIQNIPQYEWSAPTILVGTPIPPGSVSVAKWSPNGEFLAVGSTASTYLGIYQISEGVLTALAAPATMPSGQVNDLSWSPCGDFLAIGCNASTIGNPCLIIYQRTGNAFTEVSSFAYSSGGIHKGEGLAVAFSPNSDFLSMYYVLNGAPGGGVKMYERAQTTFTDITTSSTLTGLFGYIAWSPDSSMFASVDASTLEIDAFSRADYVFTAITNPSMSAYAGDVSGMTFSPDGNFLAVILSVTPYILIYKITSQTFSLLTSPIALAAAPTCLSWSANSEYLLLGTSATPYFSVYQVTNPTTSPVFTIQTAPPAAAAAINSAHWSQTKKYLAVGSGTTPYLQIYGTASVLPNNALLWTRGVPLI